MIRKAVILFVSLAAFAFSQEQSSEYEYVYRESKRLKAAGITTLILGTATMASGITLTAANYGNFKEGGSRYGDGKNKERGGYAAGGLVTALGIGVNLTAISTFKRRNRILETAKNETAFHLILKPDGISLTAAF